MIVVSDTTPLHYLVLIDEVHLLPALFGRVVTTPEVIEEMNHPQTPEKLRQWAENKPDWLEVQAPTRRLPATARLGQGEAAAISLASELGADVLLIDERDGTRVARAEGLFATGTLGVLKAASKRGLVVLRDALTALAATNYRRSPKLFEKLIEDDEKKS